MSMLDWAREEVRIATEKEKETAANAKDGLYEYAVGCYESALKAYESLMNDEHSGMSFGITKSILMRLCDAKPLTAIYDAPDVWNEVYDGEYQCRRMSGLFKTVGKNGEVSYHDVDRVVCYDISDPALPFSFGLVSNLVHDIYPIKMPYYPSSSKIKAYIEEFLYDSEDGGDDFDTVAILYLINEAGEKVNINRYFKGTPNGFTEISIYEYEDRKRRKNNGY